MCILEYTCVWKLLRNFAKTETDDIGCKNKIDLTEIIFPIYVNMFSFILQRNGLCEQ